MFDAHGGTVMRSVPQARIEPALCAITGTIYRTDGSPISNGIITFDPRVPQTVSGNTVQPLIVSAVTDGEGDLQIITLVRGLFVQVVVSDNGVTYPAMSGFVPNSATATLSQIVTMTGGGGGGGDGGGGGGEVSPGTGFPTTPPQWVWNADIQGWTSLPNSGGPYVWSAAVQQWVLL